MNWNDILTAGGVTTLHTPFVPPAKEGVRIELGVADFSFGGLRYEVVYVSFTETESNTVILTAIDQITETGFYFEFSRNQNIFDADGNVKSRLDFRTMLEYGVISDGTTVDNAAGVTAGLGGFIDLDSWRPCEPGREPPGPDEYVVGFHIEWPFLPNSEESAPARRFHNVAASRVRLGRDFRQNVAAFEHVLDGPISGELPYRIYHDDDELAVMLNCSKFSGNIPEHSRKSLFLTQCNGEVWDKGRDFIMRINFPAERGLDGTQELWREPVNAAIELAASWKLDGEPQDGE